MKNYKHSKIITEISKKLGIDGAVVNIVVIHFFNSIRQALQKNEEINLKGYFKIKMLNYTRLRGCSETTYALFRIGYLNFA